MSRDSSHQTWTGVWPVQSVDDKAPTKSATIPTTCREASSISQSHLIQFQQHQWLGYFIHDEARHWLDWGPSDHGCRLLSLPAYTVASLIHSYPRTQISPESWWIDNGKNRIKPELPLPVHHHETLYMPCKGKRSWVPASYLMWWPQFQWNLWHHKLAWSWAWPSFYDLCINFQNKRTICLYVSILGKSMLGWSSWDLA